MVLILILMLLWRFDEAMTFQGHSESQYRGQTLLYRMFHQSLFYNNNTVCVCLVYFIKMYLCGTVYNTSDDLYQHHKPK